MGIWDLYDANRTVIGKHIRGEKLTADSYHFVIYLLNDISPYGDMMFFAALKMMLLRNDAMFATKNVAKPHIIRAANIIG